MGGGPKGHKSTDSTNVPSNNDRRARQLDVNVPLATAGGDDAAVAAESNWETFEYGDQQFLSHGDDIRFERDGAVTAGVVREVGTNDLLAVETIDGERVTVETHEVVAFRRETDELEARRQELREHFENAGVGTHSDALEEWTDDKRYQEFQEHLRSAPEIAATSPMYDRNPEMETATAALATTDEETATTIQRIQSQTKTRLPEAMTVYRGISVDAKQFLDEAATAMETDNSLRDPGFQSASIDRDIAEGFGNVTLEIQTDHGVYVRAASDHAGEDELLLPAGTEYEVTSVDRETNTVAVTARGGYDFGVDVDIIRETMAEKDCSYAAAVEDIL